MNSPHMGPPSGPVPKVDTNVELESMLSARMGSPVQPGSYSLQLKTTRKTQFTLLFPQFVVSLLSPSLRRSDVTPLLGIS